MGDKSVSTVWPKHQDKDCVRVSIVRETFPTPGTHQRLFGSVPFRSRDRLSSWGPVRVPPACRMPVPDPPDPSQQTHPLASDAEQPPGDPWPLASQGLLNLPSARGSTAVASEGGIPGPQLGSRDAAGPARQRPPRERQPDTDLAVQQLKGRAAGGATFEAMPISALKMYATLVKLSACHAAVAADSCWWRAMTSFKLPMIETKLWRKPNPTDRKTRKQVSTSVGSF